MSRRRWDELDPELREDLQARTRRNRHHKKLLAQHRREQRGPYRRRRRHRVDMDERAFQAYRRLPGLLVGLADARGQPRPWMPLKREALTRVLTAFVVNALAELRDAGVPLTLDDAEYLGRNRDGNRN